MFTVFLALSVLSDAVLWTAEAEYLARSLIARAREDNPDMPRPLELLEMGMRGGVVFTTENPAVVLRVGPAMEGGEQVMAEPEIQATGGVAKIYGLAFLEVDGVEYVVTWKEWVDEHVYWHLAKQLSEKELEEVSNALVGLYHISWKRLQLLKRHKVTEGLAQAIYLGLPTDDLDLSHNLGVNAEGNVVAFDV